MTGEDGNAKALETLLDQFIQSYLDGEAPDPLEYVRRAGDEGPRLRELIAVFLAESEQVAPTAAAARDLVERYRVDQRAADGLLDQFIQSYLDGEAPDPLEYVRRAGDEGPRLRELIAVFLAESEQVAPTAAAAKALSEKYGPPRPAAELGALGQKVSRWGAACSAMLREWVQAAPPSRWALLDALAGQGPAMQLTTENLRSAGRLDAPDTESHTFQLEHPSGANATVMDDGSLVVTIFALPEGFICTRPLVAFPCFEPSDDLELVWAGRDDDLPDGIVQADETVGRRRELHATIGRLGERRARLEGLLSDVRVLAEPAQQERE